MSRNGHGLIGGPSWSGWPRKATHDSRCANTNRSPTGFARQSRNESLSSGDLDAATTERLRQAVLKEIPEYVRTWGKFCLGRFIEHLSETGVATVPEPPAKKATALDRLRDEYEAYLRRQRGLAESTIAHCTRFLERFVAFRFGEKSAT